MRIAAIHFCLIPIIATISELAKSLFAGKTEMRVGPLVTGSIDVATNQRGAPIKKKQYG
jgi:hypothetical protein